METKHALTALTALSQESRLTVFRTLVKVGPDGLSADKLAACVDASTSSLSSHLEPLLHAKLVSRRRHGCYVIYSARYDQVNNLLAYLLGHC